MGRRVGDVGGDESNFQIFSLLTRDKNLNSTGLWKCSLFISTYDLLHCLEDISIQKNISRAFDLDKSHEIFNLN